MPRPVLFFLLFLSTTLHAQDSTKGWAATLTATTVPIGQPGLGIQPGVEYNFNERYSLLAEVAFRVNNKVSKDSTELDKQYLKFKAELRYHLPAKKTRWSHDYFGFQVSRSIRKFTNRNGFYYDHLPGDSVFYYSSAAINSPVTTASLQFGTIVGEKRFTADVFVGIGARFSHTTLRDVVNPIKDIHIRGGSGIRFTTSYSYAGNKVLFHMNGGIRFMWHFYNFKHPRK